MSTSLARPPLTRADLLTHTVDPWPAPGRGDTLRRWSALADIASRDLPLVKLVEPHHDAAAILADLGRAGPRDGQVWAVWAAEPPFAVLSAVEGGGGWSLSGRKAFCSGAALATHALVTAETSDGSRLFSVDLATDGIEVTTDGPTWSAPGMSRAGTTSLRFTHVAADPVGGPGAYVDRPGFWLGAIGIAACWLGGARGVGATLEHAAARLDAHGLAHLGAVRAALDAAGLALEAAAARADREPLSTSSAHRLALSLRAHVAGVVETVVGHVGKALGPGPLAFDAAHAEHVTDLQVFVRQHHAERDLAELGGLHAADGTGGTHA